MVKLFSYGTLIEKEVQLREFGQEFKVESNLDGVKDFTIDKIEIENRLNITEQFLNAGEM